MKKIISICLLIILSNCVGYTPIFTSDQTNFYIDKIEISDDSKLIRQIIKNLKPYSVENGKQEISLKLDLDKQEEIIMKDEKGDPASYEIRIKLDVLVIMRNRTKKLIFNEKFTFNNQSNKFEMNQYKKNAETNLINKIFQDLILELRVI